MEYYSAIRNNKAICLKRDFSQFVFKSKTRSAIRAYNFTNYQKVGIRKINFQKSFKQKIK